MVPVLSPWYKRQKQKLTRFSSGCELSARTEGSERLADEGLNVWNTENVTHECLGKKNESSGETYTISTRMIDLGALSKYETCY